MKAVDELMFGIVDYAGLFPPAGQDMRAAVESYASYVDSSGRAFLGRFIVPVSRLREFSAAATDLLPEGPESEPWRLSVLVSEDVARAVEQMVAFNRDHSPTGGRGNARIEAVELKAATPDQITGVRSSIPEPFTVYFEVALGRDVAALISAIAIARSRAKVRTGGVTPDAFPDSRSLVAFMAECHRQQVAFKATAGLHHPLRGLFPLTYEQGSQRSLMFGYLNVFIAASLLDIGAGEDAALQALEERDPSAFSFSDDSLSWRGRTMSAEELRNVRERTAISFGSCSFREPVDELESLISVAAAR